MPIAVKMTDRNLRANFGVGESLLAWDITKQGNMWAATNIAVYIVHTPSKAKFKRAAGQIPYERILSVEELRYGHEVHRILRCFPLIGGYQASETGSDVTPLTDVVRQHIERLVSDRISVPYGDRYIHLVRRTVEPNHQLYWYLERIDEGLDPTSESFQTWIESTLDSYNAGA